MSSARAHIAEIPQCPIAVRLSPCFQNHPYHSMRWIRPKASGNWRFPREFEIGQQLLTVNSWVNVKHLKFSKENLVTRWKCKMHGKNAGILAVWHLRHVLRPERPSDIQVAFFFIFFGVYRIIQVAFFNLFWWFALIQLPWPLTCEKCEHPPHPPKPLQSNPCDAALPYLSKPQWMSPFHAFIPSNMCAWRTSCADGQTRFRFQMYWPSSNQWGAASKRATVHQPVYKSSFSETSASCRKLAPCVLE